MITGATGVGKSSTINALFNTEKAKVGVGTDPETMEITRYELDNLVLWDSPGLGDGKEADNRHAKNIINKLYEKDEHGNLLIDLVLVILDGSTRDLGTSYELINEVIIPNLGENKEGRILIAINQADAAAESVKRRIKEATGLEVSPIYYSAGFKFEDMPQTPPYNLAKLLYYIIEHTPKEKRLVYAENMNTDRRMWKDNDDYKNYRKSILAQFGEVVSDIGSSLGKWCQISALPFTTQERL